MRSFSLLFLFAFLFSGCGLLGGASELTNIEAAGRYEFRNYIIEPSASSLDSHDLLGNELSPNVTIYLAETGAARIERLRGDRVEETLSTGSYTIHGHEVRLQFDDLGDFGRSVLMPRSMIFEADGTTMEADIFLEGVNLEDLSEEYRGITRADVRLKIEIREISA